MNIFILALFAIASAFIGVGTGTTWIIIFSLILLAIDAVLMIAMLT